MQGWLPCLFCLFQGWRDRSARKRHKIRPLGIFGEREQSRYLHVYQYQQSINCQIKLKVKDKPQDASSIFFENLLVGKLSSLEKKNKDFMFSNENENLKVYLPLYSLAHCILYFEPQVSSRFNNLPIKPQLREQ